jgi:hypothetical protein
MTYSTKSGIRLLERHKMKFLPEEDELIKMEICVNDSYIAMRYQDDNRNYYLFFCKHDFTAINKIRIPTLDVTSLTCTTNFVYFLSTGSGMLRCTDQALCEKALFDNYCMSVVAADIETDLLYFGLSNTIFVGNEQGEVLHRFYLQHWRSKLFVSCNLVLTSATHAGSFFLYTKDGKQITQKIDKRIKHSNICLIHNQGIVVTMNQKNEINLWRVV